MAAAIVAAIVVVGAAARVSIPLPPSEVPLSAQSLAVVLVGALAGWRLGATAMLAYLALGAAGLPLFSDGGSGFSHLSGPTGGFLAGFVPAAAFSGHWVESGRSQNPAPAFAGMLIGHLLILVCGWSWLTHSLGPAGAWSQGVEPFLVGAVAKSALAATILVVAARRSR